MTYAHELHGVDIMHGKIEGNKEWITCQSGLNRKSVGIKMA